MLVIFGRQKNFLAPKCELSFLWRNSSKTTHFCLADILLYLSPARKTIIWTVFPRPISSPTMPPACWQWSSHNHFTPVCWYLEEIFIMFKFSMQEWLTDLVVNHQSIRQDLLVQLVPYFAWNLKPFVKNHVRRLFLITINIFKITSLFKKLTDSQLSKF